MTKAGYKVIGTMKPCEAWTLPQSKQKKVKKQTLVIAKKPGERIFLDTMGPFTTTLGGFRYWVQLVDNATSM